MAGDLAPESLTVITSYSLVFMVECTPLERERATPSPVQERDRRHFVVNHVALEKAHRSHTLY